MRTRFAPSPTGPLHLGHAYSAMLAHDLARAAGGQFLLRIEDTDLSRARPEWEALIYEDLRWLGLDWSEPALRQSDHLPRYDAALEKLATLGIIYPCRCSRADIRAAMAAPQEGTGPVEGPYPGTCRDRAYQSRSASDALRLNMARALSCLPVHWTLSFTDTGTEHPGTHQINRKKFIEQTGDIVLGRRDIGTVAYVLASVCDDAEQGITHVIRGTDLFEITFEQRVLQSLLDLPTPIYHHHRLIRDDAGKRLAKRDDARSIRTYRDDGATPEDIRRMIGLAGPCA